MENISHADFNPPLFTIRLAQKTIQDFLKSLKQQTSENTTFDISLCDNVKEKILDCEDDLYLSKNQNNFRRVDIASELSLEITMAYRDCIDFEFASIVFGLLNTEKYKHVSGTITKKKHLELQKEKYFIEAAIRKILLDFISNNNRNDYYLTKIPDVIAIEHMEHSSQGSDLNMKAKLVEETPSASRNVTPIREYYTYEMSDLQLSEREISKYGREAFLTPVKDIELPHSYLAQHFENLDEEVTFARMPEIENPSITMKYGGSNVEEELQVAQLRKSNEAKMDQNRQQVEDDIFDYDLIPLNLAPVEITTKQPQKKQTSLIIDQEIIIPNYVSRAQKLNRNIRTERIQVYNGPPQILESMSVLHMMTNSSFRSSLSQPTRNSAINLLYKRHLILDKKPHRALPVIQERARGRHSVRYVLTSEEHRVKMSRLSADESKVILSDMPVDRIRVQNLGSIPDMHVNKENLISHSVMEPTDMERTVPINESILPSPQVHLKGRKLPSEKTLPSLCSSAENPPNEKWCEFSFVFKKLKQFWLLLDEQDLPLEINAKELFSFESDYTLSNFFTLLRVLDKLSLQKKIVLKYQKNELLINAFQGPYVTNKQYHLIQLLNFQL